MADALTPFSITIEAEARLPQAIAQVARFNICERSDNPFLDRADYWLDLCLTPRPTNSCAAFTATGGTPRFSPLGDLFLVPPGAPLRLRTDPGETVSILCHLSPATLQGWFEAEGIDWTPRRLDSVLDIRSPRIRALMVRLAGETRHPGFASETMIGLLVTQIAIELARHCRTIGEGPARGGLAPWRLRLIDARLAEASEAPTLSELADLCALSVRQLTRGFRTSRDTSIGDYILRSRIARAKRLLADGQSVKAVAFAMGFSAPSGFSYAFRQATGVSPNQFRQRTRLN